MQRYYHSQIDLTRMSYQQLVQLNTNPFACIMLINNPEYIQWDIIPYNANNWYIYTCYPGQISWLALKMNPKLKQLIRREISTIDWKM